MSNNESLKLTTANTEHNVDDVLKERSKQFRIPVYQREYKWTKKNFEDLVDDLEGVYRDTGSEEINFLGVTISLLYQVPLPNGNSLSVNEVIDGQQRLTTIFLFWIAIVEHLSNQLNNIDLAKTCFQEYLTCPIQYCDDQQTNLKVWSSANDRPQIIALFNKLEKDCEALFEQINSESKPFWPKQLIPVTTGKIAKMHKLIKAYLNRLDDQQVLDLIRCLRFQTTLVTITTAEVSYGPKIFERWNAMGQTPSISDLVRNQIFSLAEDQNCEALDKLDMELWKPFQEDFNTEKAQKAKMLDKFLFAYGLIKEKTITQARLFSTLRRSVWVGELSTPAAIIEDLSSYKNAYLTVFNNENLLDLPKKMFESLHSLLMAGAPQTTFPFLTQLLHAYEEAPEENEKNITSIFKIMESYIVRRLICRVPASGFKTMFGNIWDQLKGDIRPDVFKGQLLGQTTEKWPEDEDVRRAVKEYSLASSGIIWFLLQRFDEDIYGNNNFIRDKDSEIEHIYPQNPEPGSKWGTEWNKDDADKYLNTLANLVPLHKKDNASVGRKDYEVKQETYQQQNSFTAPRKVAEEYANWNVKSLDARRKTLTNYILQQWKK